MKRIAIIAPGGIGPAGLKIHIPPLAKLVERLSAQFDITVFSLNAGASTKEAIRHGDAVVRYVDASYDSPFPRKVLALRGEFLNEHRRKPFDIIHGLWATPCGAIAVLLGKRQGIPSIVTLLGGETAKIERIHYGNLCRRSAAFLTRWVCRRADHLVVLTTYQAQQLDDANLFRTDLHLIPIGPDEIFVREARKRKPSPPYRFLHVGSMTKVKDQSTLLRAFAEITLHVAGRLRVIGADYMDGRIPALAHELGLQESVRFLGQVEHGNLPRHYLWADFLLHTSMHEAQSVAVAEAAASGTVIAGTRVGLASDLGVDRCITSEVEDHAGLAERVLRVLMNAPLYRGLQNGAHEWAVQHPLNWTVGCYERLYNEAA